MVWARARSASSDSGPEKSTYGGTRCCTATSSDMPSLCHDPPSVEGEGGAVARLEPEPGQPRRDGLDGQLHRLGELVEGEPELDAVVQLLVLLLGPRVTVRDGRARRLRRRRVLGDRALDRDRRRGIRATVGVAGGGRDGTGQP